MTEFDYEELKPCDSHKSFYRKAIIRKYEDDTYRYYTLLSYNTHVCTIRDNKNTHVREFKRSWYGYSVTTMRHIVSFLFKYHMPTMNKEQWCTYPINEYMAR